MFIDNLLLVSDAQAFTGAATVSTNVIDLGNVTPKREIGTGEGMGFGVAFDVAAGAGSTPVIDVIQSDAAAMTSPDVIASVSDVAANLTAGKLLFVPIPPGKPTKEFLAIRVTITGGTTTATLTSWLTHRDLFSITAKAYAKSYVV
ncbi:MAG TPA: hypothetical protein VKB41_05040 [Steroidobacteraceae bacterium]|nr:hypothetical protein [Steroidobacteraceae bacterium]